MKVGDLVLLRGGLWSSYGREGQFGLLVETDNQDTPWVNDPTDYCRVLWHDGIERLYKTNHLEVINESR